MRHFPLFLDLSGRTALVVGSGPIAERKADPLRKAGANVVVRARFDPADLHGCVLAIGADAPAEDLVALSVAAQAIGIPVNVVDRPGAVQLHHVRPSSTAIADHHRGVVRRVWRRCWRG
jgi:uroporphyrin-III C-methyltransferase/precorrin-2 dehydrogenase/sirohydrochlorin ferrochelatase